MKYRKLRIAWSVGCAIACVLLIALWVRSYWRADTAVVVVSQSSIVDNWFLVGILLTAVVGGE